MKFNINPQYPISNAMVCILFLVISLMFFACVTFTEGNELLNQDPPKNLRAETNSTGGVNLSWNYVSNADGYYIYRSTSSSGTYTKIDSTSYTTTSYTDNSLSSGTYFYKIAAYNRKYGSGPWSSYVSAAIQRTVSGLTATANSSTSITVSWNSVSGATGYYIYRSTSSGGTYTQVGSSTTNSYTNTSLSSGTTYYYKVAAYNSSGTGSQSSYVSARTTTQ